MPEPTRASRYWETVGRAGHDLRYASRIFSRTPGFTAIVVLTLALGIGASVAIFSVVDAVMLRPLPFQDPAALYAVWQRPPRTVQWTRQTVPYRLFLEWQRDAGNFESLAGLSSRNVTLQTRSRPELVRGDAVSANFFTALGVRAAAGRTILPGDADGEPVVVLSDALWKERFGGDAALIGQSIALDAAPYTVVGVLPPGVSPPILEEPPALWTLLRHDDPDMMRAGRVAAVGRLRAGVEAAAAQAELTVIQDEFQKEQTAAQRADGVIVRGLQADRAETIRPTLILVAGAVAALLLIGCANVASLMLGRSVERAREMAVRASLGASRGRLVRQLVTELTLLWSLGGAVGVALALVAVRWFAGHNPFRAEDFPLQSAIAINARAVAFACGATLATAVAFGLLSAVRGSQLNLVESLRGSDRGTSSTRGARRWRAVLVTAEMSLSVLLLAGAALFVTSLSRLASQPLGFHPEQLLTFTIQLPQREYATDAQRIQFQRALLERLSALPGIEAVGTTSARPLGSIVAAPFTPEGQTLPSDGPPVWSGQQAIDAGYFRAAGISVSAGRAFDEHDVESSERVVIINETLAHKYLAGQDPIGRRLKHGAPAQDRPWMRVVGVVKDVKHAGLEWDVMPEAFVPYAQISGAYAKAVARDIVVTLRTRADSASFRNTLSATVWSLDRSLPVAEMTTAEHWVAASADRPRFRTWLVSAFAIVALLLASVGLFGVLSQAVVQRRRELGIRMALGASRTSVLRVVVGHGMLLAAVGAAAGLAATLATARVIGSLLYGVSATDPIVLATVVATLLVVALLASVVPAARAMAIDPLAALRGE